MLIGCTVVLGCNGPGGGSSVGKVSDVLISSASAAERGDDKGSNKSADSSPFIVGAWKFINGADGGAPSVDTEFRFINPTSEDLTLEYAFFEADGGFCGCDRDDFPPNKTTEYTMLDETNLGSALDGGPLVFSCTGASGALKSIVFKSDSRGRLFLDDGAQVGFQTHAFGAVNEGPNVPLMTGNVMTEAPLQGIALTESTLKEIRTIHEQCVTVNGPL
jgi:hypothetical protein